MSLRDVQCRRHHLTLRPNRGNPCPSASTCSTAALIELIRHPLRRAISAFFRVMRSISAANFLIVNQRGYGAHKGSAKSTLRSADQRCNPLLIHNRLTHAGRTVVGVRFGSARAMVADHRRGAGGRQPK